jgi:hypothetical protein
MSIARHHNDWLSLVPNSGPFLSLPGEWKRDITDIDGKGTIGEST